MDVALDATPGKAFKGGSEGTVWAGLVMSLAFHVTIALPFVLGLGRAPPLPPPPRQDVPLVFEFEGPVADTQREEQEQRETASPDVATPREDDKPADTARTEEPPPPPVAQAESENSAPTPPAMPETAPPDAPSPEAKPVTVDMRDITGAGTKQDAQTIRAERDAETDRLRNYARGLSKKIQANLVYPREARDTGEQGNATVSFTILMDGRIEPDSARITVSSGQANLDHDALQTVRRSAPFEPPPEQMTVSIVVGFGQNR